MREYCAVIVAALAIIAGGVSASQIPKVMKEPKCPPSGIVKLPHPTDCSSYYICQDGKSTIRECPHGLHFNNDIKQCDWPSKGCLDEKPETQPLPEEKKKGEEEEEKANTFGCFGTCPLSDPKDRTIHLPHKDCTKFCKCSNGTPFLFDCPDGLHWDKRKCTCNWPGVAKCRR